MLPTRSELLACATAVAFLVAGCSGGGGSHTAPTTTIATTSSTAVTTTTLYGNYTGKGPQGPTS